MEPPKHEPRAENKDREEAEKQSNNRAGEVNKTGMDESRGTQVQGKRSVKPTLACVQGQLGLQRNFQDQLVIEVKH